MDHSGDQQRTTRRSAWKTAVRLLIVVAAVRIFLTTTVLSSTVDEGVHLLCGLEWVDRGTYSIEEQHPPLARIAIAIGPYLAGARLPEGTELSNMWQRGSTYLYKGDQYQTTLMLARLGALPFFLVLGAALAVWAYRWFGSAGAVIAVALLTTAPPILANAGLATTDMASTATIFIAIGSLFFLISRPSMKRALVAGVCLALALLAKFSAIPFLGFCLASLLFFRWLFGPEKALRDRELWRSSGAQAAYALLVCAVMVWAGYRFSVGPLLPVSDRPHEPFIALAEGLSLEPNFFDAVVEAPVYPASEVARGILQVRSHNVRGHRSFLLGEIRTHGWWYFFPAVFAYKTPIPFLFLGLAGLVWIVVLGFRRHDWRLPALATCAVAILVFVMTVSINLGLRHVLILYPLLALAAASLGSVVSRSRPALAGIAVLLLWQGVESINAHPNYLAYFNQFAGDHPEDIRIGADLDWGQDLYLLGEAVEELHIDRLSLYYFGSAIPEAHLSAEIDLLEPSRPAAGWVAISLTALKTYPEDYGWLEYYEPHSLVGKTIRLYEIPEEAP